MDLAKPKKEWVITKEAFDCFLTTLDEDRNKAGEKYEYIRLQLIKYFQWCGSDVPDIDADETINRVIRRMGEGENVYNLNGYIYGVAKLVRAESLRRRNRKQALEQYLVGLSSLGVDAAAAQYQECLERCLLRLGDEDRQAIIEYYRHEKAERITDRKRIAARLGVSLQTLRVKMHRQRLSLEVCVKKCVRQYES